jgi:hypothetical protein
MPFKLEAYASLINGTNQLQYQQQYFPGSIALYSKDIKYPPNSNNQSQPLSLVYASDSFNSNIPGEVPIVFIYKINK